MKIKLKNTKLADEYKRPILFFHTSPVGKIDRFFPLSHFGTRKSAQMRGMHYVYQALGIPEPAVLPDELPENIRVRFSKLENAPKLFTHTFYLYSKFALKIPDFGKHDLELYKSWFSREYAPKAKFLTGRECLEGDGVGETKTAYKKALKEFIFIDPFKQSKENLEKELSADSLFLGTNSPFELAEKVAFGRLIRFLEGEGYDAFVYKNDYEDKGKESYIIFRSEQVFSPKEEEHIIPEPDWSLLTEIEKQFFQKHDMLYPRERVNLENQRKYQRLKLNRQH